MYIYKVHSFYGNKLGFNSNYQKWTLSFCIPNILWNKIEINKIVHSTNDVVSETFKKGLRKAPIELAPILKYI